MIIETAEKVEQSVLWEVTEKVKTVSCEQSEISTVYGYGMGCVGKTLFCEA